MVRIVLLFVFGCVFSQQRYVPVGMIAEQYDNHMQWWDNAKFGLFIHWGLYSVAGGEWNDLDYGKEQGGPSAEWLMLQAKISKEDYKNALASKFNPTQFDAEEWVLLAKNAGMKYINITAKHHDGFSLFDTQYSDFDVMEATPFKRDILKELADACRKHDMKLGFYYSHHIDWWRRGLKRGRQLKEKPTKEYHEFVKNQLTELLTHYGDIMAIWFDLGSNRDKEENLAYYNLVRELQPHCIVSGRLQPKGKLTDYFTPADRTIVAKKQEYKYAEACMTTRLNWGYDKNDTYWPKSDDLIRLLCLSTARHSNFLLNVGPQPNGEFTKEEKRILTDFGDWMHSNKEAIYHTEPSPYNGDFIWGTVTQKNQILYAHVLNTSVNQIKLPLRKGKVKCVEILGSQLKPKYLYENNNGLIIDVPKREQLKSEVLVVKIEFKNEVLVDDIHQYHWKVPTRDIKGILKTEKDWIVEQ